MDLFNTDVPSILTVFMAFQRWDFHISGESRGLRDGVHKEPRTYHGITNAEYHHMLLDNFTRWYGESTHTLAPRIEGENA